VRLRPNRGLPCRFAFEVSPTNQSSREDVARRQSHDGKIPAHRCRLPRNRSGLEHGGHLVGRDDAGSLGSDGASPYPDWQGDAGSSRSSPVGGRFSMIFPCQPGQGTAEAENPGEKKDQRDPKHERPDRSQQDVEPKIFTAEPVRENRQRDKQHCQYPARNFFCGVHFSSSQLRIQSRRTTAILKRSTISSTYGSSS
jgi:hypothetical protein